MSRDSSLQSAETLGNTLSLSLLVLINKTTMPHGGGHVSHGGGGHHHFGGHHHHHNHFGARHHMHNRHYGGVVYTGGGGYYYRSRRRAWIWSGVGIFLVITIIVAVSCSVTLSREEDEEKRYSPGDTRIKKFDNFFCSGVKPKTVYNFNDQHATAYIIKNDPPLGVRNNITVSDIFTLYEDDYNYWHFYLHTNSTIIHDGCVNSGVGYWFYIIKGTSKWNKWKDYSSSDKAVYISYVTGRCNQLKHLTYLVSASDHYYIVYYNDDISQVKGNQTLLLDRYEYSIPTDSNLSNCSFAGPGMSSSCSVDVPLFSDQSKVLLKFPNVDISKQEDTFDVNVDCIPRVEAYLIVVLPPVVVMTIGILCLVLGCYCRNLKKRQYQSLLGRDAGYSVPQPAIVNPPPINPGYPGEAPPPYKT